MNTTPEKGTHLTLLFPHMEYTYTRAEQDSVLAFAVARAKSDGSYYKKRGNIEEKVRSDVVNGALGEFAARALLVEKFPTATVSEVDLTVYAIKDKSYKPDFVVEFNGYPVSVHVKMHVCGRYSTIRPSFLFQKPGVGLHRDRELLTIKPNGESSDLFVGVLGFVTDPAKKRADGSVPVNAVADKATVIGPFSFQQIVDQNLWHEPDAEGVRRRGKKIALLAQELCEKVPAIQGVVA